MAEINKEAWARMRIKMAAFRPPLPDFNPGDAVEIQVRGQWCRTLKIE
jgi:hypothetical protein